MACLDLSGGHEDMSGGHEDTLAALQPLDVEGLGDAEPTGGQLFEEPGKHYPR